MKAADFKKLKAQLPLLTLAQAKVLEEQLREEIEHSPKESLRRALLDVKEGRTRPIEALWKKIDSATSAKKKGKTINRASTKK
jgi:hypothetical protein